MAYSGTKAKIPLGDLGLLTDIAPDKSPPNALIKAKNVCFFNGSVQKAPGGLRWNATALGTGIIAAHQWMPNLVTERMIAVTSDGNIHRGQDRQFNMTMNATIANTLTPNCAFVDAGAETAGRQKKLFLFTEGKTNPYVLSGDGTAFATIASPATDWTSPETYPKFGVIHRNRLWAFAGQNAYASNTSNHETFTSGNLTEPIYPGEGGEIRSGFVFKGRLFAFKDGGFSYILNDADTSDANWYWQKVSSNFGLAAPNAIDEVGDDLVVGNTEGTLTSYVATEKLGSVEAADIIQNMQFESYLRGNSSKTGVPFQHVHYYAEKKLLFATYRSAYYTYNDMLIAIDFAGKTPRPAFWVKGYPQCLASYRDVNQVKRPMYGDKDGYLVLMDREDRTEGGSAYTGEFQIPHLDFSHVDPALSQTEKHFDFLSVHYAPESTGNLSCDYFIDGRFVETLTFQMVQYTRPELGILTLGTDRLAQPNTETCTRQLSGTGRTFSARFYQAGSNQSFQVPAITVCFRPGGDKAQQT